MGIPSEKLRDRWLDALLPEVEKTGWTVGAMRRAAAETGLSAGEQALAAPNGITDLIDHFFERSADQMLETLATEDLGAMRTHERVAAGLLAWLEALDPYKSAVRKAAGRGLLPWGAGAAVKRIWTIADTIWEAAGDTATDYNRQTKRALLSAVIPPIVLHWLHNDDPERLELFIERRLQRAMKLGQAGGKILGPVLDFVEQTRAGRKRREP
ncbi:MAG: COQ9 family protein [Henriciella sp.]|nr:COQ9 family protein [Henriciella sp.]